jgi:hypothetical protein
MRHNKTRQALAFGTSRGARCALPWLQRAVMGICAWVALATATAACLSCPSHQHLCPTDLLPRSPLLSLRGGGPAAYGGPATYGGEVGGGSGDLDRQMRDSDLVGQHDRAAGRGEPCVDWRAYRPNTEAEQRRESKLAGDGSAPLHARWRCPRHGAMPATRRDVSLTCGRGARLAAELFDSKLLKEGDLDVACINRCRKRVCVRCRVPLCPAPRPSRPRACGHMCNFVGACLCAFFPQHALPPLFDVWVNASGYAKWAFARRWRALRASSSCSSLGRCRGTHRRTLCACCETGQMGGALAQDLADA